MQNQVSAETTAGISTEQRASRSAIIRNIRSASDVNTKSVEQSRRVLENILE